MIPIGSRREGCAPRCPPRRPSIPSGTAFQLALAKPGCGGVLSQPVLPAGSFRSLNGGLDVRSARDPTDSVTGAALNVFVRLTRRPGTSR